MIYKNDQKEIPEGPDPVGKLQIPQAVQHTLTHTHTHTQPAHTHTQQTKNYSILKYLLLFLGWRLPFLYMRRKHAVVTEQIDFRFLKTLANTELAIFLLRICVYNERFAVNMWSVKAEQRSRITTVGNEVPPVYSLASLAASSISLLWSFLVPPWCSKHWHVSATGKHHSLKCPSP